MKSKHAKVLMSLLGDMTLNAIMAAGALEAVKALASEMDPRWYIDVPHTGDGGLRKVDAIKTLRIMHGDLGLKEAKDMIDAAFAQDNIQLAGGSIVRIGPFDLDDDPDNVETRVAAAKSSGQYSSLLHVVRL